MNSMNDNESMMQLVRNQNAAYRYAVLASCFPSMLDPTTQNRPGAFSAWPLVPPTQLQNARTMFAASHIASSNNGQALLVHQRLQAARLRMAQESLLAARLRYPLTHVAAAAAAAAATSTTIRDCTSHENHGRIERQSIEQGRFNLDNALLSTLNDSVETSVARMHKVPPHSAKHKRAVRKKPKDQPKRALSAYNIFFQEERQRIMKESPSPDISTTQQSSTQHRSGRPSPHRKIGFVRLAQTVAERWQGQSAAQVAYYQDKANQDKKRFQDAMIAYRASKQGVPTSDEE
jgi:HMG-box domain